MCRLYNWCNNRAILSKLPMDVVNSTTAKCSLGNCAWQNFGPNRNCPDWARLGFIG